MLVMHTSLLHRACSYKIIVIRTRNRMRRIIAVRRTANAARPATIVKTRAIYDADNIMSNNPVGVILGPKMVGHVGSA